MSPLCVDCGEEMVGSARQRRRCRPCKASFRNGRRCVRVLGDGELPPQGVEPGRYVTSSGYVILRWRDGPNSYVWAYEHRWVTGASDGDEVHHRNHDRSDNRPENLEVLTPQEHAARHGAENRRFDVAVATRLYLDDGLSTIRIAKQLGVHPVTIWRGLVRHGVALRSEDRIAIPKKESQ